MNKKLHIKKIDINAPERSSYKSSALGSAIASKTSSSQNENLGRPISNNLVALRSNIDIFSKKFINLLMIDGKKTKAEKLFFEMLWFLKKRIQIHSKKQEFFQQSVFENLQTPKKSINFSNSFISDYSTLYYLSQALQNVIPSAEVRKVRVAGSTYLVPAILSKKRQESLAIKWIIDAAKKKQKNSKSPFAQCLADEIYDAVKKQGQARQKRDELHRLAEANRAYIRYRWW